MTTEKGFESPTRGRWWGQEHAARKKQRGAGGGGEGNGSAAPSPEEGAGGAEGRGKSSEKRQKKRPAPPGDLAASQSFVVDSAAPTGVAPEKRQKLSLQLETGKITTARNEAPAQRRRGSHITGAGESGSDEEARREGLQM